VVPSLRKQISNKAWRVHGNNDLQISRTVARLLNKQSRTTDKWWYSSSGVMQSDNNSSP